MPGKIIPLLTAVILMGLLSSQAQIGKGPKLMPLSTAQFKTTLYTAFDLSVTDGNTVVFDPAYSNNVDADDVPKISNPSENLGILRDGIVLIIEGRQPIIDKDTIFFKMWNMAMQGYQLEFTPTGFPLGTTALLQDNYLGTSIPISLLTITTINFSINADAASSAEDRFMVVFNASVIPVTFLNLTASQTLQEVRLDWNIANEIEVDHYEAERSVNGMNFEKISNNILPKGASGYSWNDVSPERGVNFYRVKAVDKSGHSRYTGVVKLIFGNRSGTIIVSPNPVTGSHINFQFLNEPRGIYDVELYNSESQLLSSKKIDHPGGSSMYSIEFINKLSFGMYYLKIILPGNKKEVQKIIIN